MMIQFLVWFFLVVSVSTLFIEHPLPRDGKHIWMWWDGPKGSFHDIAVRSWTALNPCYDFHLLNESSVEEFFPWKDLLNKSTVTFTKSSQLELLKVLVLSKYGGVWIDSSVFCWEPLDEWLPGPEGKGYFVFKDSKNDRQISTVFMAGIPNSAPMAKLENYTREYMLRDRATPLSPCCDDSSGDWVADLGVPFELVGPNISGKKLLDELEKKGKSPDHTLNYFFNQLLLDGDEVLNRQWENQRMKGLCFSTFGTDCKVSELIHQTNTWLKVTRGVDEDVIHHLTTQIAKYSDQIKKSREKCSKT